MGRRGGGTDNFSVVDPDPQISVWEVMKIQIRRLCMFLGLPEPHPDPLVRGTDPRIRIYIRISTKMSRIRTTGFGKPIRRLKIKLRRPLKAHRGGVKAQIGAIEVTDFNLFDEEQDPDSEPHQSEKPDPYPHQSEKRDPDPHHSVSDSQH
jgi:hypothetical protein